ncbi:uncharacterized protein LOC130892261 [Diorhabda carinulata]|uniref:uncharacterized protein LOC130892261 n=1 Tax=Diorhabda carinulata TaxID=1163345 RepID=UPI0025A2B894|nr:uncharacterized protein LOC130892261 [Diorhabda carinulata]
MIQLLNKLVIISVWFPISIIVAQKLPENIDKWLRHPCGDDGQELYLDSTLNEALEQLYIFINLLNNTLNTNENYKSDIEYGSSCPNSTHLIWRFTEAKKVRVFYNMLLEMAKLIYNILNTIPNTNQHIKRRIMYTEVLFNLRSVICSFKNILTIERKPRKLPHLKMCFSSDWNESNTILFDLQFLNNLRFFFLKSYNLLINIDRYDKTILTEW